LTALALADILHDAGLPDGVINVVLTDQPQSVVDVALDDARVRKLSFTGSTAVGRHLLAAAAQRVVNTSLELGGNAPFIVCADADVKAAVDGAVIAKMRNGGQACTAANKFLVHRDVIGEFTAGLTERMAGLVLGPGLNEQTQLGPMVSERARTGIGDKVEAARSGGAAVRLGGTPLPGPGFYYPPTVLTNVAPDAEILSQEVFGPVAPIVSVASDDEALDIANTTEVGLAAYVYTGDLARGLRLAERLEVGMVGLNRGMVSDAAAPFGGVKQSGLGREGGFEGISEYLETMYVATSWDT
jgi:succinate-semialdehyde dehydrogenase/glutarate-semialdehyde dehydrogenase